MAVLHIDKVEAELPCNTRGAMELANDLLNVEIAEDGIIVGQSRPPIQNRMPIEDSRLSTLLQVRTTETSGMRELQADQQSIVGAGGLPMFGK